MRTRLLHRPSLPTPRPTPPLAVSALATLLVAAALTGLAGAAPPVVVPLTTEDACASWRWIGITTNAEGLCPVPDTSPGLPRWQVSNLFANAVDEPVTGIPPGLRPYCLYEHPTRGSAKEIMKLVPESLSAVTRDCLAVASAGDELEQQTWSELEKQLLRQAGEVSLPEGGGLPVRLAIIDTQPRSEGAPDMVVGTSPHGYTLANIARRLLCAESPRWCVAHLASHLALPYLSYDAKHPASSKRDDINGGHVGTFGDLAAAIREAVASWQQLDPPETHLVLHLAVAWQDESFGGTGTELSAMAPSVQAVHSAIVDAVCRGALVVAAAGNTVGGPDPEQGPLLPAGWEMLPAPGELQCASLLSDQPLSSAGPQETPLGQPLLWAAGGVTSNGLPLSNARPHGMPRLTAVADHAVVEGHLPGIPTATLTGSSVATTVVAAAAAAVWYYRPELDRFQVVQTLLDGGDDLGWQADFCPGTSGGCGNPGLVQNAHRISVCQSVARACPAPAVACGGKVVSCPPWSPALPTLTASAMAAFHDFDLLAMVDATWVPAAPEPACVPQVLHPNPDFPCPADPCPHSQYYGVAMAPWISPQPGSNPCPNCVLSLGLQSMVIEIGSGFTGAVRSPTLIVDGLIYNLAPTLPGDSALIELPGVPVLPTSEVAVSFTVNGTSSATSPILVVP